MELMKILYFTENSVFEILKTFCGVEKNSEWISYDGFVDKWISNIFMYSAKNL